MTAAEPTPTPELTPEPTPTPTPEPTPTPGWREGLSAEIKDHPALADLSDVPALAKSYLATKEMVGRKGVILPKEGDATDQDRFYSELGRPTTPEGYDLSGFTPPEGLPWSDDFQAAMLPKLHAAGLTQAQALQVVQDYAEASSTQYAAIQTTAGQGREAAETALKTELGASYDASIALSKRAFKAAAGKNFEEVAGLMLADGTELGNHPAFVRTFISVGKAYDEHGLAGDKMGGDFMKSPEQALREINEIEANPAFWKEGHPEQKELVAKRHELAQMAYPEPAPEVLK